MKTEILVDVTRGDMVESRHRGAVAVVDAKGQLVYSVGDPGLVTYMRSAAKPVQALGVVLSGAADRFGFTPAELAVMCASHYAEPIHLAAVRSILSRIGLDESALRCGPARPLKAEVAYALAEEGVPPRPLLSDCSGKHAGMLAVCVHRGYSLDDYLSPTHPLQQEIRSHLAAFAGVEPDSLVVGVDGCSAPVFALPLVNMALAFARLARPAQLPPGVDQAAERITRAMLAHPEMIAGTDGFCTELIRAGEGRVIAKLGAEGLYCIGLPEKGWGIALKIEDGAVRAVNPTAMEVLRQVDGVPPSVLEKLRAFHSVPNRNDEGQRVGWLRPVFHLKGVR